ncbi:hypothetical protein BJY04DRAFT_178016 [Aspergillus karnatakaensis]|uniref:uncharacterized protein n=1 Tax=Aspergillus karnatakaensis TaxID=1810916 RepID=UPI003CCDA1BE
MRPLILASFLADWVCSTHTALVLTIKGIQEDRTEEVTMREVAECYALPFDTVSVAIRDDFGDDTTWCELYDDSDCQWGSFATVKLDEPWNSDGAVVESVNRYWTYPESVRGLRGQELH